MVLPIVLGALGAGAGHIFTKDIEEKKAAKKMELVKKLANLTPQQAAAMDAVQKMTVKEGEERVKMGIGPLQPLPEQAAQQAQENRAKLQERFQQLPPEKKAVAVKAISRLNEVETEEIKRADNPQEKAKEIAARKVTAASFQLPLGQLMNNQHVVNDVPPNDVRTIGGF